MAKKQLQLVISDNLVSEPFLYQLVKQFDIVPSVRNARVEKGSMSMTLEISAGNEDVLEHGVNYMKDMGISVSPVFGDIMES